MPRTRDYTGQRFGTFVAVGPTDHPYIHNRVVWLFKCDCGEERTAVPNHLQQTLNNGYLLSCPKCNPEKLPQGQAARNMKIAQYRNAAQRRNIPFDLSHEDASSLLRGNCFYCGVSPKTYQSPEYSQFNGGFYYNGIDRMDNDKGYTLENCVSCCEDCNRAKLQRPANEFISWIWKAAEHLKEQVQ